VGQFDEVSGLSRAQYRVLHYRLSHRKCTAQIFAVISVVAQRYFIARVSGSIYRRNQYHVSLFGSLSVCGECRNDLQTLTHPQLKFVSLFCLHFTNFWHFNTSKVINYYTPKNTLLYSVFILKFSLKH
jgi:hypothetical protein